jgi:phospholipid/cholesterol/gamma-HCH transport system permease protein
MRLLAATGSWGRFAGAVLVRAVTPPWSLEALALQLWRVVVRSLLPVVAVVGPAGMVLALQGLGVLRLFGAERLVASLESLAVFRELAPVLTAALVAAQAGSTFAAELGTMRIREELDATEVMAVDGLRIHVVPRVLAAMLGTPILLLAGALAGLVGGWLTTTLVTDLPQGLYWRNLWAFTAFGDIAGGLVKGVVFGLLVGLVACHRGWNTTGGAAGIGRAVNDTVVVALTACVVVDYFLTSALFGVIG